MAYGTDAMHRATGRLPQMFRAPYGAWSPTVLQWCEEMRMIPLGWSVDPRDWSLPGVAAIIENIMENTVALAGRDGPGSVKLRAAAA